MKTSSSKAKGKRLERLVRDKLLEKFPLTTDDIRCTISSETGADLKLSKKAQKVLPLKFECKSRSRIAVYDYYEQACRHQGEGEPCLIIKADRKKPLVIVDLDYFLELVLSKNKSLEK